MEQCNTKTQKKIKDKSDRATRDSVLDNRTLTILQKLMKRNMLTNLQGCLSTGKEANVYAAFASSLLNCKLIEGKIDSVYPCAIKIYQTSIMEFKDRLKYIQSEKRFATFCNTNPRKLIKLWAEKEVRNLKRLNKYKIPSPTPIYIKNNIVIMTLIEDDTDNKIENDNTGKNKSNVSCHTPFKIDNTLKPIDNQVEELSIKENKKTEDKNTSKDDLNLIFNDQKIWFKPAKRLKDYICDDYNVLYDQSIEIIANMYKKCGLIHADYSEYNLLVAKDVVYVIDVGQSVEKDHDNADEFLIKDIYNINMFFKRKDSNVKPVNEIYEFVTGKHIPFCLKGIDLEPGVTIPNNIHDVTDEKDFEYFLKQIKDKSEDCDICSDDINVEETNNDEINKEDNKNNQIKKSPTEFEQKDSKTRKEHKKIVKEEQREKRKNKIPKKEKKRKEKLNKKRK